MKTGVAVSAGGIVCLEDDDAMRIAPYDFRGTGQTRRARAYDHNICSGWKSLVKCSGGVGRRGGGLGDQSALRVSARAETRARDVLNATRFPNPADVMAKDTQALSGGASLLGIPDLTCSRS